MKKNNSLNKNDLSQNGPLYLETDRIYLREILISDEENLLALDSDPQVMEFLTNGVPSTRESIRRTIERIMNQLKASEGKYGVWAALEKEQGNFIGWFHLFPPMSDPQNTQKLFLGYRLLRKFWGNGYATEVSGALLKKAFEDYGATEVCAQAMKKNVRSQNVMTKIGMTFRSEFQEKTFPHWFSGCGSVFNYSVNLQKTAKFHFVFIVILIFQTSRGLKSFWFGIEGVK
jgi:RimJ/RimL family protein N-acetyltransferase